MKPLSINDTKALDLALKKSTTPYSVGDEMVQQLLHSLRWFQTLSVVLLILLTIALVTIVILSYMVLGAA